MFILNETVVEYFKKNESNDHRMAVILNLMKAPNTSGDPTFDSPKLGEQFMIYNQMPDRILIEAGNGIANMFKGYSLQFGDKSKPTIVAFAYLYDIEEKKSVFKVYAGNCEKDLNAIDTKKYEAIAVLIKVIASKESGENTEPTWAVFSTFSPKLADKIAYYNLCQEFGYFLE